jgi:uncharacterized protein YecA (UPF0149 family)
MTEDQEKTKPAADQAPQQEHVHGPDCDHHHHAQEPFRRESSKLGRNDPCTCGSGKKFKKCCGKAGS